MGTMRSCKVEFWLCKAARAAITAVLGSARPMGEAGGDVAALVAVVAAAGPDLGRSSG
jgi:hypothetical protein